MNCLLASSSSHSFFDRGVVVIAKDDDDDDVVVDSCAPGVELAVPCVQPTHSGTERDGHREKHTSFSFTSFRSVQNYKFFFLSSYNCEKFPVK